MNEICLVSDEQVVNEVIVFIILNLLEGHFEEATSKIFIVNSFLFDQIILKNTGLTLLKGTIDALIIFKEVLLSAIKINAPRTHKWSCLILDLDKLMFTLTIWTNFIFEPILLKYYFRFVDDGWIIIPNNEPHFRKRTIRCSLEFIYYMIERFHHFQFLFAFLQSLDEDELNFTDDK